MFSAAGVGRRSSEHFIDHNAVGAGSNTKKWSQRDTIYASKYEEQVANYDTASIKHGRAARTLSEGVVDMFFVLSAAAANANITAQLRELAKQTLWVLRTANRVPCTAQHALFMSKIGLITVSLTWTTMRAAARTGASTTRWNCAGPPISRGFQHGKLMASCTRESKPWKS